MVALGVVGRDQGTYDARRPRGLGELVADLDRPFGRGAQEGLVRTRIDADQPRHMRLRKYRGKTKPIFRSGRRIEIDEDILIGHLRLLRFTPFTRGASCAPETVQLALLIQGNDA